MKDDHLLHQIFNEGNLVMVYLWKEWFPRGTYHKLKYNKIGPCDILKKINGNSYTVDRLDDINFFLVLNIFYLVYLQWGLSR